VAHYSTEYDDWPGTVPCDPRDWYKVLEPSSIVITVITAKIERDLVRAESGVQKSVRNPG
jgi:hypothetical protein